MCMEQKENTYRAVRVDSETAERVARLIDGEIGVGQASVRGLADAVRATEGETPEFVPDKNGYFETTTDSFEDAIRVLSSLTRLVAYTESGSPVFSWQEDGQMYLRSAPEGPVLKAARDEGLDIKECSGIHEGVLAEDEGNRKAEEKREEG